MANIINRRKAISLRLHGLTYTEIKQKLHIPKSTLSIWLSHYPLTKTQLHDLQLNIKKRKMLASEKTSQTKFLKKEKLRESVYRKEYQSILPLTQKELYLAGLM